MSGFDIDPTELFAAGARLSEAAADGHEALARVRTHSAALREGGWRGVAANAFEHGLDEWMAGVSLMLAGLEDLSSALNAAGHDYEDAESGTDVMLRRLAS